MIWLDRGAGANNSNKHRSCYRGIFRGGTSVAVEPNDRLEIFLLFCISSDFKSSFCSIAGDQKFLI